MSLNFEKSTVEAVKNGELEVTPEMIVKEVCNSLPEGGETIVSLCKKASKTGKLEVFNPPSISDNLRGQILRIMASDAIRQSFENKYGINLAFRNCHAVGAAKEGSLLKDFSSFKSQVLAQSPELRDC